MKAASAIFILLLLLPFGMSATIHNVSINGFAFSPAIDTINVGDTVLWSNLQSGVTHTVTADNGSFNSGNLAGGSGVFSHEFSAVGSNPYHCSIHTSMHGTIVVQPGSGIESLGRTANHAKPRIRLLQNPIRDRAIIEVENADPNALLEVHNIAGALVARLHSEGGQYTWEARQMPAGTYFLRLKWPGEALTGRVTVER